MRSGGVVVTSGDAIQRYRAGKRFHRLVGHGGEPGAPAAATGTAAARWSSVTRDADYAPVVRPQTHQEDSTMTIEPGSLTDPVVRAFVAAVNANDAAALAAVLTPDATMSDDGSDRDLQQWTDKEIFSADGHMDVVSEADAGRTLVADFRNTTWGEMRTAWRFTVTADGRISRFETGQA